MTSSQVLLTSGGPPPQVGIPQGLSIEQMLLYSAWIHGMRVGQVVHRLELFSYIQSHIANKADETLQTVIEKKPKHWIRNPRENGFYVMQNGALEDMRNYFGEINNPIEFSSGISFFRDYKGRRFSVTAVLSRDLIINLDSKTVSGSEAINALAELGQFLSESNSSKPRKIFNWILKDNDYTWTSRYKNDISETKNNFLVQQDIFFKEEDDELSFPEGREIYKLHRSKERNKSLIDLVKKTALNRDNKLRCQVCKFSFSEIYGDLGEGFIEAHHIKPLSELSEQTETRIEDIILVCSNCHRMLHRKRPWLTTERLQYLIKTKD
jgi:predicted HNH restriction endonuclease